MGWVCDRVLRTVCPRLAVVVLIRVIIFIRIVVLVRVVVLVGTAVLVFIVVLVVFIFRCTCVQLFFAVSRPVGKT